MLHTTIGYIQGENTWTLPAFSGYAYNGHLPVITQNINTSHFKGYEHDEHLPVISQNMNTSHLKGYEHDEHLPVISQNMNTSHFYGLWTWWTPSSDLTEHEHFPFQGLWT